MMKYCIRKNTVAWKFMREWSSSYPVMCGKDMSPSCSVSSYAYKVATGVWNKSLLHEFTLCEECLVSDEHQLYLLSVTEL